MDRNRWNEKNSNRTKGRNWRLKVLVVGNTEKQKLKTYI